MANIVESALGRAESCQPFARSLLPLTVESSWGACKNTLCLKSFESLSKPPRSSIKRAPLVASEYVCAVPGRRSRQIHAQIGPNEARRILRGLLSPETASTRSGSIDSKNTRDALAMRGDSFCLSRRSSLRLDKTWLLAGRPAPASALRSNRASSTDLADGPNVLK